MYQIHPSDTRRAFDAYFETQNSKLTNNTSLY